MYTGYLSVFSVTRGYELSAFLPRSTESTGVALGEEWLIVAQLLQHFLDLFEVPDLVIAHKGDRR